MRFIIPAGRGQPIPPLILFRPFSLLLGGRVLTRVVTVPMHLGPAVISIVPVAGNEAHAAIGEAAAAVDDIPL